ncbi:hypothetical protein TIFTF001_056407, partial [Ficus carica]
MVGWLHSARPAANCTKLGFWNPNWPNLLGHLATGWACLILAGQQNRSGLGLPDLAGQQQKQARPASAHRAGPAPLLSRCRGQRAGPVPSHA